MAVAPPITLFLSGGVYSAISLLYLSPVVSQVLLLESAATTIVDKATLGATLAVFPEIIVLITSLVSFLSTELGFLWVGVW